MFSRVCLKVMLSVELWKHVLKSAGTEGHTHTEGRRGATKNTGCTEICHYERS